MRKRFYAVILSLAVAAQSAAVLAAETDNSAKTSGTETIAETVEEILTETVGSAELEGTDNVSDGSELLRGITAENYPLVDGSTATLPLSAAVYRLVTGCSLREADEAIVHSKTTNSWLKLVNDEVDLLIVADKNETVDAAMAEAGVSLDIKPIALDAFVFMTNEENPVESLTQQEIVDIYSGAITNWSQVGGEDKEIIPFQRNENAGSQTAMKSLVMNGVEMIPPEKLEIATMSGLLEAVAAYNNEANALGYSYYYYSNLMYQTPGLRFMAVDGVVPGNESVQDGSYPYIAQYYAAVRSDEPEGTPARQIYDWLTTTSGQELAADLGYIPVDTEVKPEQVHYDEYATAPIPIAEDERLIVLAGNNTMLVLDQNGAITQKFENASGGSSNRNYWMDAEVVSVDTPISISIKTGEGEYDYKAGLYSLKEDRWLIEPEYTEMYILSDNLVTDSSIMVGGGDLMKIDGTVLASTEYYAFTRQGDFVFDDTRLYDLEGNVLAELNGYVNQVFDDRILLYDENGNVQMLDSSGTVLWQMGSELTMIENCGSFLNWVDANGAGIITDLDFNRMTDDVQFYQNNPNQGLIGAGLRLQAQSPDGQQNLVSLEDGAGNIFYYLCDSSYQILTSFAPDSPLHLTVDYAETENIPWTWQVDEKNQFHLTNLWTEETLTTEFFGTLDGRISVTQSGNTVAVSMSDSNWQYSSVCFINGQQVGGVYDSWINLVEAEDQIIAVYSYDYKTETSQMHYYMPDGTEIKNGETGEIIYADADIRCVRYGSYIYVEDQEGNLYVRLLASDEERMELEETYY